MELHQKTIQRAIASELVNDTSNVIKLISNYDNTIDNNITYSNLLNKVLSLINTNSDFEKKFFDLLIKNKRIIDYHNAVDPISAISSAASSLFNVISTGINASAAKKQGAITRAQINAESTQSIMNYMMQEEENRLAKQQSENNIIYLAIGGMVLIVGIIIFKRK
jgi:hypothetical protein